MKDITPINWVRFLEMNPDAVFEEERQGMTENILITPEEKHKDRLRTALIEAMIEIDQEREPEDDSQSCHPDRYYQESFDKILTSLEGKGQTPPEGTSEEWPYWLALVEEKLEEVADNPPFYPPHVRCHFCGATRPKGGQRRFDGGPRGFTAVFRPGPGWVTRCEVPCSPLREEYA